MYEENIILIANSVASVKFESQKVIGNSATLYREALLEGKCTKSTPFYCRADRICHSGVRQVWNWEVTLLTISQCVMIPISRILRHIFLARDGLLREKGVCPTSDFDGVLEFDGFEGGDFAGPF